MSVLDHPDADNSVAVHDFVFSSRQPETNPSLKTSLADLPRSAHERGIHMFTHSSVCWFQDKTMRRGSLVSPEGQRAATAEAMGLLWVERQMAWRRVN